VSELLDSPPLRSLVARVNRSFVISRARRFLDDMRTQVQSAASSVRVPTAAELAERIADWIKTEETPPLRPVINATGIILHSDLGRVPLADEAIQSIAAVARGYASLELDLATGECGHRRAAVERLLTRQTGAEAAIVVNNNASAMLITLAALARGREVIVSRGQLIELEGGCRLPDLAATSGAILREVGTTNQTRLADYAAAICPQTAALLRVHACNFAVVGAKEEATLADLVTLAGKQRLPLIHNIGSASLIDLAPYGLPDQPIVSDSVRAGADLVLFSGDKLLGGPQCGIIVGRKSLLEQVAGHSLMRALRADKLTLAALNATLQLYDDVELAERSIPLLSLLATPLANLEHRATRLAPQLAATALATVEILTGETSLRGIALPRETIPTVCLALTPSTGSAESLAAALRCGSPAVVGRIQNGKLLLDLRSVQPRDDAQLVVALESQRPASAESAAEVPQLTPA
jgi:L-seryl-tRNA(Ser) seleniumtransferase